MRGLNFTCLSETAILDRDSKIPDRVKGIRCDNIQKKTLTMMLIYVDNCVKTVVDAFANLFKGTSKKRNTLCMLPLISYLSKKGRVINDSAINAYMFLRIFKIMIISFKPYTEAHTRIPRYSQLLCALPTTDVVHSLVGM